MDSAYDCALTEVGDDGLFQKKFDLLYNMGLGALWAMAYMNIILVLVVIPHNCKLPTKPENITESVWKGKYLPKVPGTSLEQNKYSSCLIYIDPDKSNETKVCEGYEYDHTWYQSTLPSDNDWVCDSELNVANVFAYSRIGEIFGSLLFGWFGDMYGRRFTYIISLALIIVGRLISIAGSKYFIIFVIGCVVSCLPSWLVMQSVTVISLEISAPTRRTSTATIRIVSWSFGVGVMPLLYWWLGSWKLFMTITTVTLIPYMLFSWKMIESPRWLWVEGKPKQCITQLKKIAKVNKKSLSFDTEKELLRTSSSENKTNGLGPLALFSSWKLTLNTILQLLLWVSASLGYTVILMTTGEKSDANPYLEFTWQTVAEIPGNFIGKWLSDHVGRRYAGVTAFSVSGFTWALIALRETVSCCWIQAWWLGSIFILINRLSTTLSYYVINMFNMELYPTCLRQSGMSLGNVVSSGASAIAPYIVYLGRRVNSQLPGVIMCFAGAMGVISSLLLPETLNAKLPETLEDAQNFGKKDSRYQSVRLKDLTKSDVEQNQSEINN